MNKKRVTKTNSNKRLETIKAIGPYFLGLTNVLRVCIEHHDFISTFFSMM